MLYLLHASFLLPILSLRYFPLVNPILIRRLNLIELRAILFEQFLPTYYWLCVGDEDDDNEKEDVVDAAAAVTS